MKIVAFGASTSRTSINKALATYAASLVKDAEVTVLDLSQYSLPLYSEDVEKEQGQPEAAQAFLDQIAQADALVISYAEHNGHYPAAYKNLFDWATRVDMKVFKDIPAVYLATSPGAGGASSVLAAAINSAPFFAGNVKGSLSIPSFYDQFDLEKGQLTDPQWQEKLQQVMDTLSS
ncbi:NADPH-dependent FMN reductase [Vibrio hippocampi]|uniref:FMN-dependent NADH-azoreductase n=1 Tax=Vibrio hippocampi TaxID=654686 RepID=A0ABM8ZG70_9VIBR|nr:NAD(P)H-dependent oxidoreductase [Vibrio hippocampi]CAH0525270.1 FMN-dependent NADH-azoreductase [Vibrio hippocampi]